MLQSIVNYTDSITGTPWKAVPLKLKLIAEMLESWFSRLTRRWAFRPSEFVISKPWGCQCRSECVFVFTLAVV